MRGLGTASTAQRVRGAAGGPPGEVVGRPGRPGGRAPIESQCDGRVSRDYPRWEVFTPTSPTKCENRKPFPKHST